MADAFTDAQAWYDRAQRHIGEYRYLIDRVWRVRSKTRDDGSFQYSLCIDRALLSQAKPISGEVANALFQSLDNIIGAAARAAGVDRSIKISWPWKVEPDADVKQKHAVRPRLVDKLKKLQKEGLPDPWLELIEATFAAPATPLAHIDVMKEVSNSGKHWELLPTITNAVGMMWMPPGESSLVPLDIPADHFSENDEFLFHEGAEIDTSAITILIGFELVAATRELRVEPIFAFDATSRFVATALEKAKLLWNETAD